MSGAAWDARIGRLTTVLLALCALTMGYGFLMPSPAAPARAKPGFHAMAAPAAPVRLVVPALRIKAPILPIEVNAQAVLDPPRDPHDVGWWRRSARPEQRTARP